MSEPTGYDLQQDARLDEIEERLDALGPLTVTMSNVGTYPVAPVANQGFYIGADFLANKNGTVDVQFVVAQGVNIFTPTRVDPTTMDVALTGGTTRRVTHAVTVPAAGTATIKPQYRTGAGEVWVDGPTYTVQVSGAANPELTVALEPTLDTIKAKWTSNPPSGKTVTGFVPDRDGYDDTGAGPWAVPTPDPATATERTFNKLLHDTEYTIGVQVNYSDSSNHRVTAKARTLKPSGGGGGGGGGQTVYASGLPWSDGAFTMHDASNFIGMQNWLGRHMDNVEGFTIRSNWTNQLNFTHIQDMIPSTFNPTVDDLVISVPLWTDDGQAGSDSQWTQLANLIKAIDPAAIVRLGWEFNCCYSKVSQHGGVGPWKTQYNRAAGLMAAAAPNLHFSWNPNEGVSSGTETVAVETVYPGDQFVHSVALDAYDWYNPYNSDGNWANHRDKTYGWNYWYNFAMARGKTFGLAEYGLYSASGASGGDNPDYFKYVYGWLREKHNLNPGSIRYVTYFNETASYYQGNVYPTSRNPNGAAEYKAQRNLSVV